MPISTLTRRLWITSISVATLSLAATTPNLYAQQPHDRMAQAPNAKIGLSGYCPVCVTKMKKWEKGDPNIRSTFDGVTYLFPNAAVKQKFDEAPAEFVPALNGDCIVCLAKAGKRVPGSVEHASIHNGRLYLFPSEKEKQIFQASPREFETADIAAKGECIVCLAKANKHVPGSTKFTAIHNGLRYLFPSDKERAEFQRAPAKYAQFAMASKNQITKNTSTTITVAGRSGCAACEHGVTPLASPDELGLAINTQDGRVVVIEDAHRLYPEVYAARFAGQQIQAEGMIIKAKGSTAWLKPTSLRVLN